MPRTCRRPCTIVPRALASAILLAVACLAAVRPCFSQAEARVLREGRLRLVVDVSGGSLVRRVVPGYELVLQGVAFPPGPVELRVRGRPARSLRVAAKAGARELRLVMPVLPAGLVDLACGGEVVATLDVPLTHAWFNRVGDGRVVAPGRRRVPMATFKDAMTRLVSVARRRVDLAMSDFDEPAFVEALVAAHRRGVMIRLATDPRTHGDEARARRRLTEAGVPWRAVPPPASSEDGPRVMHHKFMVIDGTLVWTGHTKADVKLDRVNKCAVTVASPRVAAVFIGEVDRLWGSPGPAPDPAAARSGAAKPKRPLDRIDEGGASFEIWFQPCSRDGDDRLGERLLSLIDEAREEVIFIFIGFSGPAARAFAAAHRRGVRVLGLSNATDLASFPLQRYLPPPSSVHLATGWADTTYTSGVLCQLLIIDRTTVAISSAALVPNTSSDENLLVVHQPALARQLLSHAAATLVRSGYRGDRFRPVLRARVAGGALGVLADDVIRRLGNHIRVTEEGTVARIGGWSDHWPNVLTAVPHLPAPRSLDDGERWLTPRRLHDAGISVGTFGGRAAVVTAEGRSAWLGGRGEIGVDSLPDLSSSAGTGLVLGPYEEGVDLPAGRVTNASGDRYLVDGRGLPVLTDAGLARLPSGTARRFVGAGSKLDAARAAAREKRAREPDGPHFARLELIAAITALVRDASKDLGVTLQVAELSCPLGGYPDYDGDGCTDDPVLHRRGEAARLFGAEPLSQAAVEGLVTLASDAFSTVVIGARAVADPVACRRHFAAAAGWHLASRGKGRTVLKHDVTRTTLVLSNDPGIRLMLREE